MLRKTPTYTNSVIQEDMAVLGMSVALSGLDWFENRK